MKLRNDLKNLSITARDIYKYLDMLVDLGSGTYIDNNNSCTFTLTRVVRDISITIDDTANSFRTTFSIYEMLLEDWPPNLAKRELFASPYIACMDEVQKLYDLSVSMYLDNYFT